MLELRISCGFAAWTFLPSTCRQRLLWAIIVGGKPEGRRLFCVRMN